LCNQDEFIPSDGVNYDNKDILREANMQVVNCSTAANYFHLLRTHMRMPFRKPLIVAAPKKLLKFKGAGSDISEFGEGTRFRPLITDVNPNLKKADVKRIVLCSGQVYYDLESRREKAGRNDVAILRLESLCPFPFKELIKELKEYPDGAEIVWAQEEPKNAGGYLYADPRLRNIMEHIDSNQEGPRYAGRPIMAAAAVGYTSIHNQQLEELLASAID